MVGHENVVGNVKTTLHQPLCSERKSSLPKITWATSKHQRVTWPGLYKYLITFLHIEMWHMSVSSLARGHVIRV